MTENLFSKIRNVEIQEIKLDILLDKNVRLFLQRDDLLHPTVSGNKWRKLRLVLGDFDRDKYKGIISFGGQHSNHLVALSGACRILEIPFVAFVRGYKSIKSSPSINTLIENNNRIRWCSNEEFKKLRNQKWPNPSNLEFPDHMVIPEGGSGEWALKSCAEISENWKMSFDYACCSIGTGTTFAGMVNKLPFGCKGLGFVMLKDQNYLDKEINLMTVDDSNFELIRDYHFNGFGKVNESLISFMNLFYDQTKIKLDPVYTGKLLYGIIEMIKNDYFKEGSQIIAIHTGGLQGIAGMNERLKRKGKLTLNY